jgi:hypothetical protein
VGGIGVPDPHLDEPTDLLFHRAMAADNDGASSPVGNRQHVVRQGDCLFSIAARHGHRWMDVWDHPGNAALKKARNNPAMLLPGDLVVVPPPTETRLTVHAGESHSFRVVSETRLKLRFVEQGEPLRDQPVVVETSPGKTIETRTDGDGRIDVAIPLHTTRATVAIGLDGELGFHDIGLGHLDPGTTLSGAQGRLRNLGLYFGPVDGVHSPLLEKAVRRFQASQSIEADGRLNDATRSALAREHGC